MGFANHRVLFYVDFTQHPKILGLYFNIPKVTLLAIGKSK